jgi:hypothetical protein
MPARSSLLRNRGRQNSPDRYLHCFGGDGSPGPGRVPDAICLDIDKETTALGLAEDGSGESEVL